MLDYSITEVTTTLTHIKVVRYLPVTDQDARGKKLYADIVVTPEGANIQVDGRVTLNPGEALSFTDVLYKTEREIHRLRRGTLTEA